MKQYPTSQAITGTVIKNQREIQGCVLTVIGYRETKLFCYRLKMTVGNDCQPTADFPCFPLSPRIYYFSCQVPACKWVYITLFFYRKGEIDADSIGQSRCHLFYKKHCQRWRRHILGLRVMLSEVRIFMADSCVHSGVVTNPFVTYGPRLPPAVLKASGLRHHLASIDTGYLRLSTQNPRWQAPC